MNFKLLLTLLFMVSCASAPIEDQITSDEKQDDILTSRIQKSERKDLTGNLVFINLDRKKLYSEVGADLTNLFIIQTREYLTKNGFKEIRKSSKAHLVVHIVHERFVFEKGRYVPLTKENKNLSSGPEIIQTVTTYSKGETSTRREIISPYFQRLSIVPVVQEYGKRHAPLDFLGFSFRGENWNDVSDQLTSLLTSKMKGLNLHAPETNMKMAGDPGCLPRFGFDFDEETTTVNHIQPNSPAEAIGMKVGDVILAIDSQPYSDYNKRPDLEEQYSKGIEVPIKFRRKDQILRKNIKSKIMCNNYEALK